MPARQGGSLWCQEKGGYRLLAVNRSTSETLAVLLKGLNGNRFLFPQFQQIKAFGRPERSHGELAAVLQACPRPWAPGRSDGCSPQPASAANRHASPSP